MWRTRNQCPMRIEAVYALVPRASVSVDGKRRRCEADCTIQHTACCRWRRAVTGWAVVTAWALRSDASRGLAQRRE